MRLLLTITCLLMCSLLCVANSQALLYNDKVYQQQTIVANGTAFSFVFSSAKALVSLSTNQSTILSEDTCTTVMPYTICVMTVNEEVCPVEGECKIDPITLKPISFATVTIDSYRPQLTITRTVSDASAIVGEYVRFSVTLKNTGSFKASNIVYVDEFPDGATFKSSSSQVSIVSGDVRAQIYTLQPDQEVTLQYDVKYTQKMKASLVAKAQSSFDGTIEEVVSSSVSLEFTEPLTIVATTPATALTNTSWVYLNLSNLADERLSEVQVKIFGEELSIKQNKSVVVNEQGVFTNVSLDKLGSQGWNITLPYLNQTLTYELSYTFADMSRSLRQTQTFSTVSSSTSEELSITLDAWATYDTVLTQTPITIFGSFSHDESHPVDVTLTITHGATGEKVEQTYYNVEKKHLFEALRFTFTNTTVGIHSFDVSLTANYSTLSANASESVTVVAKNLSDAISVTHTFDSLAGQEYLVSTKVTSLIEAPITSIYLDQVFSDLIKRRTDTSASIGVLLGSETVFGHATKVRVPYSLVAPTITSYVYTAGQVVNKTDEFSGAQNATFTVSASFTHELSLLLGRMHPYSITLSSTGDVTNLDVEVYPYSAFEVVENISYAFSRLDRGESVTFDGLLRSKVAGSSQVPLYALVRYMDSSQSEYVLLVNASTVAVEDAALSGSLVLANATFDNETLTVVMENYAPVSVVVDLQVQNQTFSLTAPSGISTHKVVTPMSLGKALMYTYSTGGFTTYSLVYATYSEPVATSDATDASSSSTDVSSDAINAGDKSKSGFGFRAPSWLAFALISVIGIAILLLAIKKLHKEYQQ